MIHYHMSNGYSSETAVGLNKNDMRTTVQITCCARIITSGTDIWENKIVLESSGFVQEPVYGLVAKRPQFVTCPDCQAIVAEAFGLDEDEFLQRGDN